MSTTWTDAVVVARHDATPRIAVFDLARADGGELWAYEPGAHIDVQPHASAPVRQYSLCGPPGQHKQYRIAVLNEPSSRGGSRAVHTLAEGDTLRIAAPRNRFGLAPAARRHRLFAGGIGITPLLSMVQALDATGGDHHLHYCARSRAEAAFAAELAEHPRVTLHFDDAPDPADRLDLPRDLGAPAADTAVYVCGPGGFMDHVLEQAAALGWPASALHTERFSAAPAGAGEGGPGGGFTVRLASTGAEYPVAEDESILDVLHAHGVDAAFSCGQGICGECIVRVRAGEPDHRDDVLTDDERAAGLFTPCSSRSHTPTLELDL